MTIDKAIKVLEDILNYVKPGDPPEEHDAIKLGIEALKRIQDWRSKGMTVAFCTLPGEPEE